MRYRIIVGTCLAVLWSSASLAGISSDLKFCATLKSSAERLACYDAAARIDERKPTPAPTLAAAPKPPIDPPATRVPIANAYATIPAAYDWTGFYVGVMGGYRQSKFLYSNTFDPDGISRGSLAGGAIGYNAQIGRLVVGIEADAAYGKIGTTDLQFPPFFGQVQQSTAIGSLDLRAGLAVDQVLFFAKGGLSAADNRFDYALATPGLFGGINFAAGSEKRVHVGWNVAAGLEIALNDSWSVKGEYGFTRLLPLTYARGSYVTYAVCGFGCISATPSGISSGDIDYQTAKVGVNYRFGM